MILDDVHEVDYDNVDMDNKDDLDVDDADYVEEKEDDTDVEVY